MEYYFTTSISGDFNQAVDKITEELKKEGFGILTEIDITTVELSEDIDVSCFEFCFSPNVFRALNTNFHSRG